MNTNPRETDCIPGILAVKLIWTAYRGFPRDWKMTIMELVTSYSWYSLAWDAHWPVFELAAKLTWSDGLFSFMRIESDVVSKYL